MTSEEEDERDLDLVAGMDLQETGEMMIEETDTQRDILIEEA